MSNQIFISIMQYWKIDKTQLYIKIAVLKEQKSFTYPDVPSSCWNDA